MIPGFSLGTSIPPYFAPPFFSPWYFPSLRSSLPNLTAPTLYYTPNYYSPFYFPSLVTVEKPQATPKFYFNPNYFSPFYFPTLVAVEVPQPPQPEVPYSDWDAYDALSVALKASGEFADVAFGTTADRRASGADMVPSAVITPDLWDELDEVDPYLILRRVAFDLTVIVRHDDPVTRYRHIDRLANLVANLVDGADLGVGNLPALTFVRRGTLVLETAYPEGRLVLKGEFSYFIPLLNARATTKRV